MGVDDRGRIRLVRTLLESEDELKEDLFAPDAITHKGWEAALTKTTKRGASAEAQAEKLFRNLKFEVEDALEADDKVVVRWRLRGSHAASFAGIKPTRRKIDITGINIYRFEGEKIIESWSEFDAASLAGQIGGRAASGRGGMSAAACRDALVNLGRPPEFEAKRIGAGG